NNYSRHLAQHFYESTLSEDWAVVPLARRSPRAGSRETARKELGIAKHDFILCSFGMTGPMKLNHRLVQAWLESNLADDPSCRLIFVGEEQGGEYGAQVRQLINAAGCRERIQITGFATAERYRQYLCAADAAVQLRTLSRGETSAAAL